MLPGHAGDVLKTQEQIMENLGDVKKRNDELEKMFKETKVEAQHFAYDVFSGPVKESRGPRPDLNQ
jgi:hypothetical protein